MPKRMYVNRERSPRQVLDAQNYTCWQKKVIEEVAQCPKGCTLAENGH
ncbi:hypothetical protein ACLM5H_09165 [Fredinandcohnia humi]